MASRSTKSPKPKPTPQQRDEIPQEYEVEMSDEDSPGIPQGQGASSSPSPHREDSPAARNPISSKSGEPTVQRELKKESEAQDVTSLEFWTDKKFLTQMLILGICQALMMCVNHSWIQASNSSDKSLPTCSDCRCKATDVFSSEEFKNVIKNQQTLSDKLKQKTEELDDLVKRLAGIEETVTGLTGLGLHKMKGTLGELEIKFTPENLKSYLRSSLEELESKVKDSIESNVNEKIKSEVQKESASLNNKLQDVQGQVKESEVRLTGKIKDEKLERISKFEELDGKVTELRVSANQKFAEVESKFRGMEGQLNFFSGEIKDHNIYIVGFLLVLVMGVIFIAYKILLPRLPPDEDQRRQVTQVRDPPLRSRVGGPVSSMLSGGDQIRQVTQVLDPPPRSRVGGQGARVDIDRITKRPLDRSIGVISFNTSTQQFHQNLINKVPKPSSIDVHPCPIQCSNDIQRVNPSKVAFVFVDFNERNIILEDPETEIGDLRRLTTEGLLNMGCDIFVVYVRDRGSETLAPGQLYNPQLYSIGHHSLLSRLRERNRVLSVYNSFLPHQVKFLEDSLKRL